MDQTVAVLVAVAVAGILMFGAARMLRRRTDDDVDLNWIVIGSALLSGIFASGAGLRVIGTNQLVGLGLIAIGVTSIVLVARMTMAGRTTAGRVAPRGELSRPALDYLVWMALGMPILMVVVLVVLAISSGLGRR